jgi:putative membrane protein
MWGYDHPMAFGFGGIFMWLFWIVLIVVVVWLLKNVISGQANQPRSNSALEILEQRYAKGEIDKKEYEEKKRDLTR